MSSITATPNEETLADVEGLLHKLAWDAVKRYGGDWHDYMSACNEGYVEAYESFDPSRGAKFSTWLCWKVWGQISRMTGRTKLEQHTVNSGEDIALDVHGSRKAFSLYEFLMELSTDSQTVVKLLVESPHDIWDILHHHDTPSCVRGGLTRTLMGSGWSAARVLESFSEIREALL